MFVSHVDNMTVKKLLAINEKAGHFNVICFGCTIYDVGEEKSHFSLDGKCDGNSLASFLVS